MVSIGRFLEDAKDESSKHKDLYTKLVATLSEVRDEAEALVTSHKEDVATTIAQARKVSEEAELCLTRAVEHARLESWRQMFEDINAGGVDLIVEIERVKILEEGVAALLPSESESSSD